MSIISQLEAEIKEKREEIKKYEKLIKEMEKVSEKINNRNNIIELSYEDYKKIISLNDDVSCGKYIDNLEENAEKYNKFLMAGDSKWEDAKSSINANKNEALLKIGECEKKIAELEIALEQARKEEEERRRREAQEALFKVLQGR